MTLLQLSALAFPARSPDDWFTIRHVRYRKIDPILYRISLTIDVEFGELGNFVPPGFGGACWHAIIESMADPEPQPLADPSAGWGHDRRQVGLGLMLAVLEGVGTNVQKPMNSGLRLHLYRGLKGHEWDAVERARSPRLQSPERSADELPRPQPDTGGLGRRPPRSPAPVALARAHV